MLQLEPVSYGCFQHLYVNILQRLEFDAVPGHGGLADLLSIGLRQVGLIFKTKYIDRDPCSVGAQTDTVKLLACSVCILNGAGSISYIRV